MADNNDYGWGWSRNLPILIILLIISGFLIANVITFNNISVAPEDPNQAITKSRASYLYWFNLIILLFVITIIILLIMFMYRNKNTPYVEYFGKNINIIDTKTGKEIKEARTVQKHKKSLEAIAEKSVPKDEIKEVTVSTANGPVQITLVNGKALPDNRVTESFDKVGPISNARKVNFYDESDCANSGVPHDFCSDVKNDSSCKNEGLNLTECYDKYYNKDDISSQYSSVSSQGSSISSKGSSISSKGSSISSQGSSISSKGSSISSKGSSISSKGSSISSQGSSISSQGSSEPAAKPAAKPFDFESPLVDNPFDS